MTTTPLAGESVSAGPEGGRPRPGLAVIRRVSSKRIFLVMAWLVVAFVALMSFFPSLLASDDPLAIHPERVLQGPSSEAVLGTDPFGRGVWDQIVHGAQQSLTIGVFSVLGAFLMGVTIGLLAGFLGGFVDSLLMRIIDILLCFPGILLALIIAAALGPTLQNLIIAIAIGQTPDFARVMRGQVLAVRSRLYVEAATASGIRTPRIILRHVLPNAMAPVTVVAALGVGSAIVSGATLSFLGLGPQGGVPDWGRMLAIGQEYLVTGWWISTFPGVFITVVVIAVNILGDALRDKMDVN